MRSEMTVLQRVLLGEIRKRTEADPVSFKDLAILLGERERHIRMAVAGLVNDHHQPILSSYDSRAPGYFWPRNVGETRRHLASMLRHGVAIIRRVKTIGRYSQEEVMGQVNMFMDGE